MDGPGQDPRRVRAQLRRYERLLRQEKAEYGFYRDGAGRRYHVGPLYLLLGDLEGALNAFRWFETEFPDDSGMPEHYLCWAFALLRAGDQQGAAHRLRQAMLSNLYLIPHLLGLPIRELDIWHGSNIAEPLYLEYVPEEYLLLWNEKELEWASALYHGPELEAVRVRHIEIYRELKNLPRGPERSGLVQEASALKRYGSVRAYRSDRAGGARPGSPRRATLAHRGNS